MPFLDPWTGRPVGYDEDPYLAAAQEVLSPYVGMGGGGPGSFRMGSGFTAPSGAPGGGDKFGVQPGNEWIGPPGAMTTVGAGGEFSVQPGNEWIGPPGSMVTPDNEWIGKYRVDPGMTIDDLMKGGG